MGEKVFIIGFGFIGRYLAPCYEALLGQPGPENVLAVKASSRGLEELRRQYPYAISVGDTAEVLEREHPTILVLCPPPTEVPGIVREILAPYFERCRREGRRLPVIYTFAPTPAADWFRDELGGAPWQPRSCPMWWTASAPSTWPPSAPTLSPWIPGPSGRRRSGKSSAGSCPPSGRTSSLPTMTPWRCWL